MEAFRLEGTSIRKEEKQDLMFQCLSHPIDGVNDPMMARYSRRAVGLRASRKATVNRPSV